MVFRPAVYHPVECTPLSIPLSSSRSCRSCPNLAGAVKPVVPRQTDLSVVSASWSTAVEEYTSHVHIIVNRSKFRRKTPTLVLQRALCTVGSTASDFPDLPSVRRGNVLHFAVVFEPSFRVRRVCCFASLFH